MTLLRLSILLAIASSHAFPIPPSFVGQRSLSARLSLGKGILEMAEVDASTVFPAQTDGDESFLGNYEDLVMPGQEGHGYKLILKDDDERFRVHVKQQQQQSGWNSDTAQQRARANMGYFANRDLAGNVPETNGATSTPQMRQNMDYFSSHAVGTTIPDRTALDVSSRVQWQEHMDFFSSPSSSFAIPNDIPTDATEARARARANIDFFTLKDIGQTFNKMDEARKVARNNIDFFSDTAKSRSEKKAKDDSKERTTARLNIGYFS